MKRCGDALYRFSKAKRQGCFNVAATLWTCRISSAASAKHLAKQVAKALAAKIVLVKSKTTSTATK
jgi:hypothetical protein